MPFNLLLLPLLAGFLFATNSNLHSHKYSQLEKERLLLFASSVGVLFLVVSRVVVLVLLQTEPGLTAAITLHQWAPFPFIGTAFGTLILALFFVRLVNSVVTQERAGMWLFHSGAFDKFEEMLYAGAIGVRPKGAKPIWKFVLHQYGQRFKFVFRFLLPNIWLLLNVPISRLKWKYLRVQHDDLWDDGLVKGSPKALLLTMRDNKVLACIPIDLPAANSPKLEYVRVLPLWTGFRDPSTKAVTRTTDYLDKLLDGIDPEEGFVRVLRAAEILYCSVFQAGVFESLERVPDRPPVARRAGAARVRRELVRGGVVQ